jgi:hypothetical protein
MAFRQECRNFAAHWIDVQREEFKRLGVTGNWADPYLTMDFHAERVIAEEFLKFLMNGSLYQGSKPVMWSPVEKTALAEAEVEYHDHQTDAVWVPFPWCRGERLTPRSDMREIATQQGRHLDHHPLDDAAEPRDLLQPRGVLWPLRDHRPPRGMLGADRRPLILADALAGERSPPCGWSRRCIAACAT